MKNSLFLIRLKVNIIVIFEVMLTFELLTVRGQQHSFGLTCVNVIETENVSTWGGLEPPTFVFMPNALTIGAIRARHLVSHVFERYEWKGAFNQASANIIVVMRFVQHNNHAGRFRLKLQYIEQSNETHKYLYILLPFKCRKIYHYVYPQKIWSTHQWRYTVECFVCAPYLNMERYFPISLMF